MDALGLLLQGGAWQTSNSQKRSKMGPSSCQTGTFARAQGNSWRLRSRLFPEIKFLYFYQVLIWKTVILFPCHWVLDTLIPIQELIIILKVSMILIIIRDSFHGQAVNPANTIFFVWKSIKTRISIWRTTPFTLSLWRGKNILLSKLHLRALKFLLTLFSCATLDKVLIKKNSERNPPLNPPDGK